MEFPELGKNCSEKSCNKLDFLPMQCDSCDKVFCSEHFSYTKHSCPGAYKKDFQVPVCPLCGEPVPTPRGVSPDQTVGQHMDRYCKSETKKIFTNHCSYKNCKKKELIPVNCSICNLNFCLRHRHSVDHECKGSFMQPRDLAASAAEYRKTNKPTTLFTPNLKSTTKKHNTIISRGSREAQNIQGDMTEDEALARALALSIMELDESADRTRRNEQQSPTVTVGGQRNSKEKCSLS